MIFMKIWNKVLSEMVFSHRRVCYNARCKYVEKKNTFLHVALAKCKKQQQQHKTKKNIYIYIHKEIIFYILRWNGRY